MRARIGECDLAAQIKEMLWCDEKDYAILGVIANHACIHRHAGKVQFAYAASFEFM
jgi:hypothetical protein